MPEQSTQVQFLIFLGSKIVELWKTITNNIPFKSIVSNGIASGLSAIGGAYFVYKLSSKKERKKELIREINSLQKVNSLIASIIKEALEIKTTHLNETISNYNALKKEHEEMKGVKQAFQTEVKLVEIQTQFLFLKDLQSTLLNSVSLTSIEIHFVVALLDTANTLVSDSIPKFNTMIQSSKNADESPIYMILGLPQVSHIGTTSDTSYSDILHGIASQIKSCLYYSIRLSQLLKVKGDTLIKKFQREFPKIYSGEVHSIAIPSQFLEELPSKKQYIEHEKLICKKLPKVIPESYTWWNYVKQCINIEET